MLNTESYNRTLLTRNVIPTYYRTNQVKKKAEPLNWQRYCKMETFSPKRIDRL